MSRGLGRGFGALLPGDVPEDGRPLEAGEVVKMVPLTEISPNPDQPRKEFDSDALQELAASIGEQGILQPLLVERWQAGYRIVAGERRWRAAQIAGLNEVPVLIRSFSEETRREIALIENIQRENLTALEEARAYRQLMETCGLTQDDVAQKVGKQRSTIANSLRLLRLPEEMQAALERGGLTAGHARALLSVSVPSAQALLFRQVVEEGLSVREAEARAQRLNGAADFERKPSASVAAKAATPPEIADWEQQLMEKLGTRVSIKGDHQRGRIEVHYLSSDDLERLFELLGGHGAG